MEKPIRLIWREDALSDKRDGGDAKPKIWITLGELDS